MHANKREELTEIYAGDICAVGLRDTTTGDTLCDPAKPILLESIEFPDPVIQIAIEPKTKADQEKLGESLQKLAKEDPSFRVSVNKETAQTLIAGMGELHLEIIVDRLLREFKVDANVGKPQVAYRETIRKASEAEGRFVRQTGGHGQFGVVDLRIEPLERAADSSSMTGPRAARFRASSSVQSRTASKRRWKTGCWPAIRWWISRPRCSTASITKWIRRNSRSRLRARWRLRKLLEGGAAAA